MKSEFSLFFLQLHFQTFGKHVFSIYLAFMIIYLTFIYNSLCRLNKCNIHMYNKDLIDIYLKYMYIFLYKKKY